MTTRKFPKVQVSKERTVSTYSELWHGSWVLLQRAKEDERGSYWLWMGSLMFTAFSFEAYLNHIGPKIFACWPALEKLSPEGKLDIVCEKLEIDLPKSERPRQTIRELFKFRNNLAHGKTVTIKENTVRDVDKDSEKFFGEPPLATWEKYCTERNVQRALEDVEQVMRIIHDTAKPPNDPLFLKMSFSSASLE